MKNKKNVIWAAALLALSVGGFSAAKLYASRNASCDSSGAGDMKNCPHYKEGEAAKAVSAGARETGKLPEGHPDISAPGTTAAPPLDEKVLAKGKAADCPYISQGAAAHAPKTEKDKTLSDLEKFVLEGTPEGRKIR